LSTVSNLARRLVCFGFLLTGFVLAPANALAQDASPVASPAATPVAGEAPLDVAAMALTPDDLADFGLADFAIADGRTQTLDDRVGQQADAGEDPAAVRNLLSSIGWVRGYRSRLAHPIAAGGDDFDALVSSGVTQFADADGAEAGYTLLANLDTASGEATPVAEAPAVGDRSVLLDVGEIDLDDGAIHPSQRLIFQSGELVGDLIVVAPTDQPFAASDVVALAERQLERMDEVRANGGPDLSFKALRVQGIGLSDPDLDNYRKLDGTIFESLGDENEDLARDTETYQDATDWYSYEALITDTLLQDTSLVQFPTADLAAAWVQGTFARADENRTADSTLESVDAPTFGDESVVLRVTIPIQGGSAVGYLFAARFGDQALGFGIISLTGRLTYDNAAALAEIQVDCFAAGNCAESVPLPADWEE
jgi:hypothetical protein